MNLSESVLHHVLISLYGNIPDKFIDTCRYVVYIYDKTYQLFDKEKKSMVNNKNEDENNTALQYFRRLDV